MKLLILIFILLFSYPLISNADYDTMVIKMKNNQLEKIAVSHIQNLQFVKATKQIINLKHGWNIISSFIDPDVSNIDSLFSGIADSILILKNGNGQYFYPFTATNQIGNWNINDAYLVYAKSNCTFQINGNNLSQTSTQIALPGGWSLISYNRSYDMLLEEALSSISPNMVLAINNDGLYFPYFNINSIVNMKTGFGYWIYLLKPDTLIYPIHPTIDSIKFVLIDGASSTYKYSEIDTISFIRANNFDYFNIFVQNSGLKSLYHLDSNNSIKAVYDSSNLLTTIEYYYNLFLNIDSITLGNRDQIINIQLSDYRWYPKVYKFNSNLFFITFYLIISGMTNANQLFVETYGEGTKSWHSLIINKNNEFKDSVLIAYTHYDSTFVGKETSKLTYIKAIKDTDTTYFMLNSGAMYY
jgi:hypothetical protein